VNDELEGQKNCSAYLKALTWYFLEAIEENHEVQRSV